jgi:hypothetical protein
LVAMLEATQSELKAGNRNSSPETRHRSARRTCRCHQVWQPRKARR